MDKLKMYILVLDSAPLGIAMTHVAHASLACFRKFEQHPEVQEWISGPFYKAVCKVNAKEFENAKAFEDHVIMTESSLGGQEIAIAFRPRLSWPKQFKFYSLYRDRY